MKKTTSLALLFQISILFSLLFISSCSDDDEDPVPDPLAPKVEYDNMTVDLGGEFSTTPTVLEGDSITYAIKDAGGAKDFVSIDTNTGTLSVGKESTIGTYTVIVTASNSVGSSEAGAGIEITVPDNFNPIGMTLEWKFFINQSDSIKLVGLDGVPELPYTELDLPKGFPDSSTPEEDVPDHFVLTSVQAIMLQQPGNIFCTLGNSLKFTVDDDLNLHAVCTEGEPILIGYSTISYEEDQYHYNLEFMFDQSGTVRINYDISNALFASFSDPWSDPQNPRDYNALQGQVKEFVTPTDWSTSESISDVEKLTTAMVDVVLEVVE